MNSGRYFVLVNIFNVNQLTFQVVKVVTSGVKVAALSFTPISSSELETTVIDYEETHTLSIPIKYIFNLFFTCFVKKKSENLILTVLERLLLN